MEVPSEEITEEKVLSSWRTLEQENIARENKIADHNRDNKDLPRQMLTSYAQIELIKQEDNFFNDTGMDISELLAGMRRLEMTEDERVKAISAEEYQKHAENLGAKTTALMNKIAMIEEALKL